VTLLGQGAGLDVLQRCLQPKRFCGTFGLPGSVVYPATTDPELLLPCARKSLDKFEKPDRINTVGLWQRLLEVIA